MQRRFDSYLAIDWSGASTDSKRLSGLAVAEADADHTGLVRPPRSGVKHWTRNEVVEELAMRLRPSAGRTIVAIDAAFSFPFGFQSAVFGVQSWSEMVLRFGTVANETAASFAESINDGVDGAGPFRDNDTRNDGEFYSRYDVAYFRAVELLMPQAISPFYVGSGAKVAFHTITFLRALRTLRALRDRGEVAFQVWPQEASGEKLHTHVIAECYPALYGHRDAFEGTRDEQDALRAVDWLEREDSGGRLREHLLFPAERPFGRRMDACWEEQIRFEGWVLGA